MSISASRVSVSRLTFSLLLTSSPSAVFAFFDLRFAAHMLCMRFGRVIARQCLSSAERWQNQAGGVAALFHLRHCQFHHFINSALNSSCITNSLRYIVQYCTLNRIAEQISHMCSWRVAINCARYSHDFITLVM
jgi:hypothetical protein